MTIAGLAVLPSTVRIHWTLEFGPAFAPTTLAATTLAVVPTVVGGAWLGERAPPASTRTIRLTTACPAGAVLVVQLGLVVVNP